MLVLMLTSTIALLLAGVGFLGFELFHFRGQLKQRMADLTRRIAEQNSGAVTFGLTETAQENLHTLLNEEPGIVRAIIFTSKGVPFATYFRNDTPRRIPIIPPVHISEFKSGHLIYFRHVQLGNRESIPIFVETDLNVIHDRLKYYIELALSLFFFSLLAAFLLSSYFQRIISGPILQLVQTARSVSERKDYALRAEKRSNDELGTLTDVFNGMLQQIQLRDVELGEAKQKLELRVQERTRELQTEIGERKKAERELSQQLQRIQLLNQITQSISERQDLNSVVFVVLKKLEDHLAIAFGTVCFLDSSKNNLVMAPGVQLQPTPVFPSEITAIPLLGSGIERTLKGQSIYFPRTSQVQGQIPELLARAHLESAVISPLLIEGKLFGILISTRQKPEGFGSGECEFLRMLSEHVALAAHQARLHTELQEAYNELRQTQQNVLQEDRLRALGQMASGIAHDINNALSPVIVYSDLMLLRKEVLSPEVFRNLELIRMAGEDIAHIVARMREFYRKREDSEPLTQVDLNAVAIQVIELTRPKWRDIQQQKGSVVRVKIEFDEKLPKFVGNEIEIRESLTNLILNAVDAMPTGGTLTVRTIAREWDEHRKNGQAYVILQIIDTGIGMDEPTRSRCLDPFFSTKGQRGTGLGLAMVYGVMERHEGKIEVQSAPGEGTTMTLIFPIRDQKETSRTGKNNPAEDVTQLKILCIDDEPLLREMIRELLVFRTHVVTLADGGETGIAAFMAAKASGNPFDVVITDLGMPYVDGKKVALRIKTESPETPVVMLTGWGTMMKSDGDIPVDVDVVLSKPPRILELQATLNSLFATRKPTGLKEHG